MNLRMGALLLLSACAGSPPEPELEPEPIAAPEPEPTPPPEPVDPNEGLAEWLSSDVWALETPLKLASTSESPDGSRVVTVVEGKGDDRWAVHDAERTKAYFGSHPKGTPDRGGEVSIKHIAFSEDGSHLGVGLRVGKKQAIIDTFDVKTGKILGRSELSKGGKWKDAVADALASEDEPTPPEVDDKLSWILKKSLGVPAHEAFGYKIEVDEKGAEPMRFTAAGVGSVVGGWVVYDDVDPRKLRFKSAEPVASRLTAARFSDDGAQLAVGGRKTLDGWFELYDTGNGKKTGQGDCRDKVEVPDDAGFTSEDVERCLEVVLPASLAP